MEKDISIWQRFENRIYSSELYQIFIARAIKNKWSKITYAFFLVSLCSTLAAGYSFNHLYKLEEMNILEGKLLKWTHPRYGYSVFVKTEDTKVVKFYMSSLSLNQEKRLNMLKGEKVKCFFSNEYNPIPWNWYTIILWEIDYKGEKILNYNYEFIYPRRVNTRRTCIIMFLISLFLLLTVYKQNKK